jgi:hypothetical protein
MDRPSKTSGFPRQSSSGRNEAWLRPGLPWSHAAVVESTDRGSPGGAVPVLPRCSPGTGVPDRCLRVRRIEALRDNDGKVWTAQLSTGDGVMLIGPEMTEFGTRSVADPAWTTSRTFVYVDDVDGDWEHARSLGAKIITDPADHGSNRLYVAADCGDQQWTFATPL